MDKTSSFINTEGLKFFGKVNASISHELKKELEAIAPSLKFLFVTGHGTVSKLKKNSEKKDTYLSKPMDIEILIKKMNEVTKNE